MTGDELAVEFNAWDIAANPTSEEAEDSEFDRDAILADMEAHPENWEEVPGK